MRILGIDIGTTSGWALWEDGKIIASGSWNLKPSRFESAAMRGIKLEACLVPFTRKGASMPVDMVAYEEVRHHIGVDAAHCYGGLKMIIDVTCDRNGIPFTGFPVGTVKKKATGKGNAKKPAMIEAAERLIGHKVEDDNEADAIWVAMCAAETYGRKE